MTKMAAMPIYGKNTLKIFFSGNCGPISMKFSMKHLWLKYMWTCVNKSWPWDDLGLFYGKVKFGNIGFYMGNSENYGFFENSLEAWDLKSGRCKQLMGKMKIYD